MLVYVAIGLFAGLRRSELCALEWSEIDQKARTIEVEGAKAKTRQRRIVSISDVLSKWLAAAPAASRPTPSRNEDVCGERLKNLYSEERDGNGAVIKVAIVSPWPHNALIKAQFRDLSLRHAPRRKPNSGGNGQFTSNGIPSLPGRCGT